MSQSDDEQVMPSPKPRTGRATIVIALTVGLVAGAAAGSFVVGPLLADAPDVAPDCEALFAEYDVEMREEAPAAIYAIENIVLNPAQSGGTRFLMATVTFGMRDSTAVDHMAQRDAAIRDVVVRVLGSRSVAELSDMQVRNMIKEEMRAEVGRMVGPRALLDIYFPQFVIQ